MRKENGHLRRGESLEKTLAEQTFAYFCYCGRSVERNLTSFHIMFYHPGRWEEANLGPGRSFNRRSEKANSNLSNNTLQKLLPESFRDFILKYPDEEISVIILSRKGEMPQVADLIQNFAKLSHVGRQGAEILNMIEGFAVRSSCDRLLRIAQSISVDSIWYIHPDIYDVYARIIKSLEVLVEKVPEPAVTNISIGPSAGLLPMPFRPDEPMNRATKIAAENKKVLVFAAGNEGPAEDTLNPWSLAPWVISVGAASKDGKMLAENSSRGRPGDPIYRPTVVAPGIDIITTHPPDIPKTSDMLEAEERVGFKKIVPQNKWHLYAVVSGSSYAAPQVSRIAGQMIHFLKALWDQVRPEQTENEDRPLTFANLYMSGKSADPDDRVMSRRFVGQMKDFGGVRTVIYPIDPSPIVIKQMILDMALPMPGYKPHEVGAGFVSPELAEHYFGKFGIVDIKIMDFKVL